MTDSIGIVSDSGYTWIRAAFLFGEQADPTVVRQGDDLVRVGDKTYRLLSPIVLHTTLGPVYLARVVAHARTT